MAGFSRRGFLGDHSSSGHPLRARCVSYLMLTQNEPILQRRTLRPREGDLLTHRNSCRTTELVHLVPECRLVTRKGLGCLFPL